MSDEADMVAYWKHRAELAETRVLKLESDNASIMRDFQIESDLSVRDVVERLEHAAVRHSREARELRAQLEDARRGD